MLQGFKTFILRGNVVDLAVGVIIGAAFGSVVEALVTDVLTPLIGALVKTPDFSMLAFTINGSIFHYGHLINVLLSFILVALAIYVFVIIPISKITERYNRNQPIPEPTTTACPQCLCEIALGARRCQHCTSMIIITEEVAS